MTRSPRSVLTFALFAVLISPQLNAQQPNSPQASMVWAGVNGPAWPIQVDASPPDQVLTLEIQGDASAPILLAHTPAGVLAGGIAHPELGGFVDLDFSQGFDILVDGFLGGGVSPWFGAGVILDINGSMHLTWPLPSFAPIDLGGLQAVVASPTTPTGVLLTAASKLSLYTNCANGLLGSDFVNPGEVPDHLSGSLNWNGGGYLEMPQVSDTFGDGSDGMVSFGPGVHDIDTTPGASPSGCAGNTFHSLPGGVLNATFILVSPGAVLRVYGSHPLQWKCTGPVIIQGIIDCSAFRRAVDDPCYGKEPGQGQFNNTGLIVAGGEGGPGGGRGGRGSQNGSLRTPRGERGFGPSLNGQPNAGFPENPHFGGGAGGVGNFFTTLSLPGSLGGFGGAGGSAFTAGEDGLPRDGLGIIPASSCGSPRTDLLPQSPALAAPPTLAFVPPLHGHTAGSGGGGGGDKFDLILPPQLFDEQGGGGGGGGGCFHVIASGDVTVGTAGVILAQGAPGAIGPSFAGAGGSGSGGVIWIQSASSVSLTGNATLDVSGGDYPTGNLFCSAAPGKGGTGYIQLEDSDGVINTNFNVQPSLTESNHLGVLGYGGEIRGSAISEWFDSGVASPEYNAAMIQADAGDVPGAMVSVEFQGAMEDPQNPGQPDPATLGAWADSSLISSSTTTLDPVDGFRFVRYRITTSYPGPPIATASSLLPRVNRVYICR